MSETKQKLAVTHEEELAHYAEIMKSHNDWTIPAPETLEHWGDIQSKVGALAGHMAVNYPSADKVVLIPQTPAYLDSDSLVVEDDIAQNEFDATKFLDMHVSYDYENYELRYTGEQPSEQDKAAVASGIFEKYGERLAYDRLRDVILAAAGPRLSEGCARSLVFSGGVRYVLDNLGDFENVSFDQDMVEFMLAKREFSSIPIQHYDLLAPSVDLQSVVNTSVQVDGPVIAVTNLINMPSEITVPDYSIVQTVSWGHVAPVVALLQEGRFPHLIGDANLRRALHAHGMSVEAYRLGFYAKMSADDYFDGPAGNLSLVEMLMDTSKIQGLGTAEDVARFLAKYTKKQGTPPYHYILTNCKLSPHVQSAIFAQFVNGSMKEELSGELLSRFTNLTDEDYGIVLTKYGEILLRAPFTSEIADKFLSGASQAILDRYDQEYRQDVYDAQVNREQTKRRVEEANLAREAQRKVELALYDDGIIVIEPLRAQKSPNAERIYEGLERDHCVKVAPRLQDQLRDRSRRHNVIRYVGDTKQAIGTGTHYDEYQQHIKKTSELTALREYARLLAEYDANTAPNDRSNISSLRDDLTFIGKNEYSEAVRGIATYWKTLLDRNPTQKIFVCTQAIGSKHFVKSDEYMIDRIVAQFSNDELERYKGRFTMDHADIIDSDPKDVRIVLVDDWTISGSQLRSAARRFIVKYPQFAGRIEIQLIAASRERITLGLEEITGRISDSEGWAETQLSIPVRSYYVAHKAKSEDPSARGTCITGAHSSVDYGFENTLQTLVGVSGAAAMPPLTNIVRVYRSPGYQRVYPGRMSLVEEDVTHDEGEEWL